ncbi:hypothetical protein [Craterilacuibacter sinensis]|uniref:DUF3311 domain-containing protein n=1 Tax=Craterilacuibacter sinensis TaxID=2686017 RepID=A0A845BLI2_9NEIS|nr:hypothetical protein [Craterilacuibacter sinensis]MXR36144.1 hypothetical protein [Craterilacuibacter sinensis]
MHCLSNAFERRWTAIILALYGLIMLPLPWYYNESYLPGPLGVPMFLWGWIGHGFVVLVTVVIFARQCLARPEYQSLDASTGDEQ